MPYFPVAMRGYERRQVDELFARIEGTLGRGPAPAQPVTAADVAPCDIPGACADTLPTR